MQTFFNILLIISTIVGLPAFILSIIFFFVARKKIMLSYIKTSSTLIAKFDDDFYQDIDITFCNQKINKLTSTIFRVWNSGNVPIRAANFAQKAPLSVKCKKGILTARIIKQSATNCDVIIADKKIVDEEVNEDKNNAIGFKNVMIIYHEMVINEKTQCMNNSSTKNIIEIESNQINFDFLEPKDGFVCEIIHTGENPDVELSGQLVGGPIKKLSTAYLRKSWFFNKPMISSFINMLMSGVYLLFAFNFFQSNLTPYIFESFPTIELFFKIFSIILFGVTSCLFCAILINNSKNVPSSLID